jgi:hypothetical protein
MIVEGENRDTALMWHLQNQGYIPLIASSTATVTERGMSCTSSVVLTKGDSN